MTHTVGIVKDERFLEHKPGHTHPENPTRLRAVYRMLDRDFSDSLINIEPEPAPLEQLELVHTPAYIKKVLKTADHSYTSLAPDTPASAKTYLASWLAVGGCLKGLDTLISQQCDLAFTFVRPPGHHALTDRAGGFCFFSNLGVTARYAIKKYSLRRILIIDWDVHHGNGLNDIFYADNEVLYLSTHDKLLYPYTGDLEEIGKGAGEGYSINIPVPRDFEDEDVFYLYKEIIAPIVLRFEPELILVAAGFDAHKDDPIGRSRLTEKAFGWLTQLFLELREEIERPPILFTLEGGYDPKALAHSIKAVLDVLTEQHRLIALPSAGSPKSEELIKKVKRIHARYGVWTDTV